MPATKKTSQQDGCELGKDLFHHLHFTKSFIIGITQWIGNNQACYTSKVKQKEKDTEFTWFLFL
jgi:hypothetical protein